MTPLPRAFGCMHGFSLIEVLIALFVLAIGVIGATSLQASALQTAQDSRNQTAALQLATEMAQHLRALEQSGSTAGADVVNFKLDFPSSSLLSAPAPDCYQNACAAAEFHAHYLSEWLFRLAQELPEARVKICQDAAPWSASQGSLAWQCTPAFSTGMSAPLVIKIGWRARQRAGLLSTTSGVDGPMVAMPLVLADKH